MIPRRALARQYPFSSGRGLPRASPSPEPLERAPGWPPSGLRHRGWLWWYRSPGPGEDGAPVHLAETGTEVDVCGFGTRAPT